MYEVTSHGEEQNVPESSTNENEAPLVIEKSPDMPAGRIKDMFTAQLCKRPNGEIESTPKRRKINPVVPKRLEMSTKRNNSEKTPEIRVSEQNDEIISMTSRVHTNTAGPGVSGIGIGQFSIAEILKEKIAASKITRIVQEQTDSGPQIVYELEKDF